jgi:hypothetical protein
MAKKKPYNTKRFMNKINPTSKTAPIQAGIGTFGQDILPKRKSHRDNAHLYKGILGDFGTVNINDGVLDMHTHKIINVVDPTADQDAATKKYVDNGFLKLDCSNDPLTGNLDLVCNDPAITLKDSSGTGSSTISKIQFKDDADNVTAYFGFSTSVTGTFVIANNIQDEDIWFVWNNGGTSDYIFIDAAESELNLNSNKIVNVADPTANQDAATKKYVDDNKYTDADAKDAITRIASITLEDPTSSEDVTVFFTPVAITISEMRAVLLGSSTPSVTWTIRHHATDRSNAGNEVVTSGTTTTSTTSGSDVTSFNDATIPADSFVWLETTAQSGTVDELHVSIVFTED